MFKLYLFNVQTRFKRYPKLTLFLKTEALYRQHGVYEHEKKKTNHDKI